MDYFKILPMEITADILARLPTELVLECKLVSTTWRKLVSHHPLFSRMQLLHLNNHDSGKLGFLGFTCDDDINRKFQYFEYNENHESTPIQRIRRVNLNPPFESMIFVGSCNGLICLAGNHHPSGFHPSVWICNPITKECVMLPELKRECSGETSNFDDTSNFGYVSSNNEYKVLRTFLLKTKLREVYIYTLGSGNGWRNLGKFDFGSSSPLHGVFSNGVVYWLIKILKIIITFDLAEEKFCERLSSPVSLPYFSCSYIGVLDGYLSLVHGFGLVKTRFSHVWLLKKKNDNHDKKEGKEHQPLVWSKEFVLVEDGVPLTITKTNDVLTYKGRHLDIHDTKTTTSERLVEFKDYFYIISPHRNTFVSLKEIGEEDTKTMESVEIELTRP